MRGRHPLVSVIMPAYNSGALISRALRSVQDQSCPDWEVLVIDDASWDDTAARVADIAGADPRIRLMTHGRNQGAAAARNTGISAAQGRYIAFLDSDDAWLPDKLRQQLALMDRKGAALCYGAFWRDFGTRQRCVRVPEQIDRNGLLRGNVIGCLTAIYDREKLGLRYFPDLALRQDWALWLRILEDTALAYGTTEPIATYHVRAGSISSNKVKALYANWRLYRDIEGLHWAKAARLWGESSVRQIMRAYR